jgi:hypothetical protein
MKSPLERLSLLTIMICVAGFACSGEPSDDETTAAEAGDGDGDDMSGGESGSASGSGDGDGDGDGDAETDPDCPAGTFDCPCDDGACVEGLTCGGDGICSLGGDPTTTTGDPTTTTGDPTTETTTTGGGPAEPYDPASCEAPSEILHVELLDGEFCATPCIADDECPEGPPGTTQACSISTDGEAPNFCGLICDPTDSACPEGSSCKEIPQQAGFGLCTYP